MGADGVVSLQNIAYVGADMALLGVAALAVANRRYDGVDDPRLGQVEGDVRHDLFAAISMF